MIITFKSLLYLFFKLSPFIIACFFTISPIFDGNFKGFIYLIGLIISVGTTLISSIIYPFSNQSVTDEQVNTQSVCANISFGTAPLSFSLSIAILSYTYCYLLYTIIYYNLYKFNITNLLVLPSLIIADILWNYRNNCFSGGQCALSLIISGLIGVLWAYIIRINLPKMQLLYTKSNKEVCTQPSKDKYTCHFVNENNDILL